MKISKRKTKELLSRSRTMKARVHLGMNGVQENTKRAFLQAFKGTCVKPTPSDLIRVKVQATYTSPIEDAVELFCEGNSAVFIAQDGQFLVFWKPESAL